MIYSVVPEELGPEIYEQLKAYYADDPEVTVIVYAGRTAWLHRKYKRKILRGKPGWQSPWRAKIERYRGDIIFFDGKASLSQAVEQVKRFLESLQRRELWWLNAPRQKTTLSLD